MSKIIAVDVFNPASIESAVREIQAYREWIIRKADELAHKLADIGAVNVSLGYARAAYTGDKDISVSVEERGENSYAIVANGETLLFVEFGAGIRFGDGHPMNAALGYGPGTWPDKHFSYNSKGELVENWSNDRGWYTPTGVHTYGNPPSMTMYFTAKELRERILEVAREVFRP